MKKLLFVGHCGTPGGAGISMLRTARIAVDAGYDVMICLPAGSPMAERAASEGFKVAPYSSLPGSVEYYSGGPPLYRRTYFKKALRRRPFANEIIGIAGSFRPDAVILNSITTSFMVPRLKKAGFPAAVFVRETFPKNGSRRMLGLYRKYLSGARAVYFISDFDKNFFNITSARAVTIRNSVADAFFLPLSKEKACENTGLPETDRFRILYLGGCDTIKGSEVIGRCSEMLPGDVEIVACGTEQSKMEELFKKASCVVSYLGFCNDMRSAYGACDAIVIPIVKSHQARPLFEAGAAGLPVIISDFPEISEYIGGGANALAVTPGSPEALRDAVLKLKNDPALREDLARENYAFSKKNHGNDAAEKKIREELERLTGPSVLYVTNIPSPYRIRFLSEMNGKVSVTALFERRTSKGREKSWFDEESIDFPRLFPKGLKIGSDRALNPSIGKAVSDAKYTNVIINGYSSPSEMLAIMNLRRLKKPYTMWIDGGFKKEYESRLAFKIKKYFLSGASFYLSPSPVSDSYLTYYGADAANIVRYHFTSLCRSDIFESPASCDEKSALRKEAGLPVKGRIALAVGNFIRRKGFSELIGAAASVPDVTVVICGGEPPKEYVDLITSQGIRNVKFVGFLKKEKLKKLMRACDFFILPTREDIWGLVVNEAMACGLPVVTTDGCVAGLTMIENGVNGLIYSSGIEKGNETPGALQKNTAEALKNFSGLSSDEIKKQGANAIAAVSGYTFEECVKKHLGVL